MYIQNKPFRQLQVQYTMEGDILHHKGKPVAAVVIA